MCFAGQSLTESVRGVFPSRSAVSPLLSHLASHISLQSRGPQHMRRNVSAWLLGDVWRNPPQLLLTLELHEFIRRRGHALLHGCESHA